MECVLMGDFNAFSDMEAEISDVLIPDLGDFVPIFYRIPRRNKDEKNKNKSMGKKAPCVLWGTWSDDCKW